MNIKKLIPFALLFLLYVSACKKSGVSNNNPKTSADTDVYMGGFSNNGGTYWKNGIVASLQGSFGDYNAYIAVSGKDIYASGYSLSLGTAGNYVATIWKNGIETQLNEGDDYNNIWNIRMGNIVVIGTDVYTVASENGANIGNTGLYEAIYWKNGTLVKLTDGSVNAYANAIGVNGSDVYVTGFINANAVYWKNGNEVNLTNNNSTTPAAIASGNCISISGGNVYIGGNTVAANGNTIATYWKDGVAVNLTDGSSNAAVLAMAINNNDVYAAGYITSGVKTVATYWKNGTPTSFTNSNSYTESTGIAINGSDVYVTEQGVQPYSGYWKNNKFIYPTDCYSTSNIVVISK